MKIAIVGAGISGLAQYLWLRKMGILDDHEVVIYEARPHSLVRGTDPQGDDAEVYNPSTIGASIGLSPTGLKVLKRLDGELYDEIRSVGRKIRSWRMSTARGWTLATIPAGGEGNEMVMIGREACCEILRKKVPESVVVRRKIVDVKLAVGNEGPGLMFDGGEIETVGLVIGCDGIWSKVRKAMFAVREGGEEEHEFEAKYEGLIGVGGFMEKDLLMETPKDEMNVVLGGNGFFGYGYTVGDDTDPENMRKAGTWWSTYSLNECPADWRSIDKNDVKDQLQKRHLGWENHVIQRIVKSAAIDSLYPTFITPLLPTWEKGGCVLVGDAAHALQPSSGQGASMALEDCETLALLLKHHLANETKMVEEQVNTALRQYSNLRRPRLDMVWKKAQELAGMKQDMGFLMEMVMYFFVWLSARFRFQEGYQRRLNEYHVPTEVAKVIATT